MWRYLSVISLCLCITRRRKNHLFSNQSAMFGCYQQISKSSPISEMSPKMSPNMATPFWSRNRPCTGRCRSSLVMRGLPEFPCDRSILFGILTAGHATCRVLVSQTPAVASRVASNSHSCGLYRYEYLRFRIAKTCITSRVVADGCSAAQQGEREKRKAAANQAHKHTHTQTHIQRDMAGREERWSRHSKRRTLGPLLDAL